MNQTAKISDDELKREIVGPCGFNYNIPLESGDKALERTIGVQLRCIGRLTTSTSNQVMGSLAHR
jgi:hypothetical protein